MTGTVAVLYFTFSKAFITVSRNSLIDKLMVYGLDVWTVNGFTWQNCWAQSIMVSGTNSSQRLVLKDIPCVSPGVKYCWIFSLMT